MSRANHLINFNYVHDHNVVHKLREDHVKCMVNVTQIKCLKRIRIKQVICTQAHTNYIFVNNYHRLIQIH